jgi:hypothetical protein
MQDTAVPPSTLEDSMAPTASAENNYFLSADNNRWEGPMPDDEAEATQEGPEPDNESFHIGTPEDDEWGGFESDGEAEADQESHESDNRTGHMILEDVNSATDTPRESTSLGRALPRSLSRLGAFDERDLVSWADLNDTLDPRFRLDSNNQILVLSNVIRQMDKVAYSADEPRYEYAEFLKKIGAQNLGERILASIEPDLRGFIETGRLSFDTVNQCQKSKARTCHRARVYFHTISDPNDDNYVGLCVGSSFCIRARIKEHGGDLAAAKKRGSMPARLSSKSRRLSTSPIHFWSQRPRIQSFWLIFGQLKFRGDVNMEEVALLLNFMEMYSMLLFRTLPVQILWRYLPQGCRLNSYSWTGLNTANSLEQWRQELGFSMTKKPYHFAQRSPSARNV